jgi:hypothetical protein
MNKLNALPVIILGFLHGHANNLVPHFRKRRRQEFELSGEILMNE